MTSARASAVPPSWPRWWLRAAAIYNILWGAFAVAKPDLLFEVAGMEPLNHPAIWQCLGMIVGVYGIGYWIAASDHRRHWPIILVGLLGKIFGPIGFAVAWWGHTLPLAFGVTLLTNDLIWWLPFALILRDAWSRRR